MEELGLVRYEGEDLSEGIISSSEAIIAIRGFDGSLKWWVNRYDPSLADLDLPVPVRVNRGSWEIELPQTVGHWLLTAGGIGASAYLAKAAQKLAERDFDGVGIKDVFEKAFKGMKTAIRLGVHLGGLSVALVKRMAWKDENRYVEIENADGSTIIVNTDHYRAFLEMPSGRLSDLVSIFTENRRLVVLSPDPEEEAAIVEFPQRSIFVIEDDDDDDTVLFPELEHGDHVKLDGFVTRGNEVANSIGFRYLDHILTCYPASGSIVKYKSLLFAPCEIEGQISREDEKGKPVSRKPKIIFSNLTQLKIFDAGPELNLD